MNVKPVSAQSLYEQLKLQKEEEARKAGRAEQEAVKESTHKASADGVNVSEEAKLRSAAYSEAMKAGEVREDKVAALKAMVESGEYEPDSRDIAARIVHEDLEDWE